jgi:hypothetical protein
LICKAFSWLASKRFGELERDLEGIVVAVLKGIREAGMGSGARSQGMLEASLEQIRGAGMGSGGKIGRHYRGCPRGASRSRRGSWSWISYTFSRLPSRRATRLQRALEMDPEDIPRAGLEEMRRAGTCSSSCCSGEEVKRNRMVLNLDAHRRHKPVRELECSSAGTFVHISPALMTSWHQALTVFSPFMDWTVRKV